MEEVNAVYIYAVAMSEGVGRELSYALAVWLDERAPYNLIIVIIGVECGAEECDANFHAVNYRYSYDIQVYIYVL